jgi:cation diffusion facilitator CzcD-associated flavoprotein CzcO
MTNADGRSPRRIGIIGAGAGGICTGIQLLARGVDWFTIFERAPGVGGTWFHNTYPGLACDIPSALYSFSFEPKCDWSRPYGTQAEICEYLEHCVAKYGLRPHLRLGTAVTAARWDDDATVWRVSTAGPEPGRTDEHELDVLVAGVGMFGDLHIPDIPGLDDFTGTQFHSARWNHDHDLAGERVAVIGSAGSAVQFVPQIAPRVEQLFVFQRSPEWVMPKEDDPYTAEQLEVFRTQPDVVAAMRREVFERIDPNLTFANPARRAEMTEFCRKNLGLVEDPELRAKLTPDFPHGCKRPLISNDWYPTFNRDNVELVTDPIARVLADGIDTVDGTHRPVDTIILATGFETTRFLSTIDVTGRGGVRLTDAWRDGAHAYLGIVTAGFPNLFMLYGPNTNNGSLLFMIEQQVGYTMRQLDRLDAEQLAWIDVRPEVEAAYNEGIQRDLDGVEVWNATCNNYYRGPSGKIVTQWPHSMSEYEARCATPDPDAYEVSPARPVPAEAPRVG